MAKLHAYYDITLVLTYNAILNFIVGARGMGKTFGFKRFSVKKALKAKTVNVQGELYSTQQFIYMRRHKDELKLSANTFFVDIAEDFAEWDFQTKGWKALASPASTREDKKRDWVVIGFFIPLSIAQSVKSVSFTHVKRIIFDEFILEKGHTHYIPDEANIFMNFYSTVDRNQDKTTVYFLANSVTITNPHFLKHDIRPDQLPVISTMHKGYVLAHFPDSAEYKATVSKTRFGQYIAGTEYEAYALDNQFADASDQLLEAKPGDARHRFTLETKRGTFSIWYSARRNRFYAQERIPNSPDKPLTLVAERMTDKKILIGIRERPMVTLRTSFNMGRMFFDSPKTRNAFIDIFDK
jgi:hypothetical protein